MAIETIDVEFHEWFILLSVDGYIPTINETRVAAKAFKAGWARACLSMEKYFPDKEEEIRKLVLPR